MILKIIYYFLLFPCFFLFSVEKVETDLLIVLYDAGETNALLPVMERLHEEGKDFRVIALGTSRSLMAKRFVKNQIDLKSFGFSLDIDANWDRRQPITDKELKGITDNIEAKKVLTGVASVIQKQFIQEYDAKGSLTYAYRDNINAIGNNSYYELSREVQRAAKSVLFPSQYTADFFSLEKYQKYIVGKPSFDREPVFYPQEDDFTGTIVIWFGGYDAEGKNEYKNSFNLFRQTIENLETTPDKLKVFIKLHPKALAQGQAFEQEAVGSNPIFQFSNLTFEECCSIGNLICTYNSSLGFDALLLYTKRVFYFIPEGDDYTNIEIEMGAAAKVNSIDSRFDPFLLEKIKAYNLFEILGIPKNSVNNIINLISNNN